MTQIHMDIHYLFQLSIEIYISFLDALHTNQEAEKPLAGKVQFLPGPTKKITVDSLLKPLVQSPTSFRGFV